LTTLLEKNSLNFSKNKELDVMSWIKKNPGRYM